MPVAFTKCQMGGGKITTMWLSKETYCHICFPKGGGASIRGEIHRYKKLLKK